MNIKLKNPQIESKSSEIISFQLREMIKSGELNSGDRLPSERDLAKILGVSRPTLRAGIRSLATIGVLQPRQGAGTFVVEAVDSPSLDGSQLSLMASLHGYSSDEMFEARISIEMSIAGFAAERANSEHFTLMAEEIAGMFASLNEPEQFLLHDMKFHQTIAAASGNRILTALMNMLTQILFEGRSKTVKNATDLKESAEMHRKIYRAIRERNAEAARNAMYNHLINTQNAQRLERQEILAQDVSNHNERK